MSYYFLDSSALVKRYIVETGTAWIRSLTSANAGNVIVIAHITQAEVVSGAMRRKRDNSINVRTAHTIRLLIDRHSSREYRVVGLTAQIMQRAEDLLETHQLRAYDSVQLASAVESNARIVAAGVPPITFISADTQLMAAAIAEGLITDDPNAHP